MLESGAFVRPFCHSFDNYKDFFVWRSALPQHPAIALGAYTVRLAEFIPGLPGLLRAPHLNGKIL